MKKFLWFFFLAVTLSGAESNQLQPAKDTAWFHHDMMNCISLERPPVIELKGRFFAIIRQSNFNRQGVERTAQYMRLLRNIGITDIIQLNIRNCAVYSQSSNPEAKLFRMPDNTSYDPLFELVRAAAREKIRIWVKLQHGQDQYPMPEKMYARKPNGEKILDYAKGHCPDYVIDDYRNFIGKMIDEYAEKYSQYGNFAGIFTDMLWYPVNNVWRHMDKFDSFCFKHYGERVPESVRKKFLTWDYPQNPDDKWWRRMILFAQHIQEDFHLEMAKCLHAKGMKLGIQINDFNMSQWPFAASVNPYRWHNAADFTWEYAGNPWNPLYAYPNNLPMFMNNPQTVGQTIAEGFTGAVGGISFNFEDIDWPVRMGTGRRYDMYKRFIINTREWQGASRITTVGLLYYYNGLRLRYSDRSLKAEAENFKILATLLSRSCTVEGVFAEDVSRYNPHQILIALPDHVRNLPKECAEAFKRFIHDGGTIINLNAKWTVSRDDFTEEEDITQEITGFPFDPKALGAVSDQKFPLRRQKCGKGEVITITIKDFFAMLRQHPEMGEMLRSLVLNTAMPAVSIKNSPKFEGKIFNVLKKGNWIAASLTADTQKSSPVTVSFDMEKLGIQSRNGFRVLLLGRNRELRPPHAFIGSSGFLLPQFFPAGQLKKGITINILADNDLDKNVPQDFPLPGFAPWSEKYCRTVLADSWKRQPYLRSFEHEIIVVAPADELTVDAEKIPNEKQP